MTVNQLMGSLQAYSERLLNTGEAESQALKSSVTIEDKDKALYTQYTRGTARGRGRSNQNFTRGRGRVSGSSIYEENIQTNNQQNWRGRGRCRGRIGRTNPGRGNRPVKYYNCGKLGHFAKDCWFNKKVEENTNFAETGEQQDKGILLMACQGMAPEDNIMWYLDSGAINHMSGLKHLFSDLEEINSGVVSFGDSSRIEVKGKGKIHFTRKDGKPGSIEDVYYVPDMKNNILSLGQLLEKGYLVNFFLGPPFFGDESESVLTQGYLSFMLHFWYVLCFFPPADSLFTTVLFIHSSTWIYFPSLRWSCSVFSGGRFARDILKNISWVPWCKVILAILLSRSGTFKPPL
ncbi:uncharacterized protein LOC141680755 [Apium graveolens]|uniref:uncharacterized protein LOC141680755 n=1 Tax=Apium graveolens TaxID=4045 RepID=UPI003D7C1281